MKSATASTFASKSTGGKSVGVKTDRPTVADASVSSTNVGIPAHEAIYQNLRQRILFGEFKPGKSVTLQGMADSFGVSLTPIRESLRRLTTERVLEFRGNRRISVQQYLTGES